jgi:hypothetical protein
MEQKQRNGVQFCERAVRTWRRDCLLSQGQHRGSTKTVAPATWNRLSGGDAWDADLTVRRAIEIRAGRVQNPKILSFQSRSSTFPYPKQ